MLKHLQSVPEVPSGSLSPASAHDATGSPTKAGGAPSGHDFPEEIWFVGSGPEIFSCTSIGWSEVDLRLRKQD